MSLVMVLFWIVGGTSNIDHIVFKRLNGSLSSESSLAHFWAYVNTRRFDLWAGLGMGAFCLIPGLVFDWKDLKSRVFEFVPIFLSLNVFRALYSATFSDRLSPSRVYHPDFFSLQTLDAAAKVHSEHSFPSDHAGVALSWGIFLLFASPLRGRWLAFMYAIFLCLPRLVGGGHWLSDTFVGGLSLALLSVAWGYFFPFKALFRNLIKGKSSKP